MYSNKPIIGISGGIGAGKSFVAALFGELGCLVISSDEIVRHAYKDWSVKQALKKWWGPLVFNPDGEVDRSAVARKIFQSPNERHRLEGLLHPLANKAREKMMTAAANDPAVPAFVWDTPLLFETGLDQHCDAKIFVDAPIELRQTRVAEKRGWNSSELIDRENSQISLARKRELSQYVISNTADADAARGQVRDVLNRILIEPVSVLASPA